MKKLAAVASTVALAVLPAVASARSIVVSQDSPKPAHTTCVFGKNGISKVCVFHSHRGRR